MGASEFLSSVELPKLEDIIASYQLEKASRRVFSDIYARVYIVQGGGKFRIQDN